ncbi:hypothetical protein EIP91_008687 [Steccherinum ochraceum]|uniref:Uncharacterized protein n=1 Tax=Steccherinum ochraceum TaxID=92696 RepID=A0A4R0R2I3_9APHY|nr:hypothetical protein EIP91_008687 [Steccherinum ochraceum]
MRLATVLGCLFALAASSATAVPLHSSYARGYDENTVAARDLNLVVRDVLQAIHARELADSDVHTPGSSAVLSNVRRDRPASPNGWKLDKRSPPETEAPSPPPQPHSGLLAPVAGERPPSPAREQTWKANEHVKAPQGHTLRKGGGGDGAAALCGADEEVNVKDPPNA